MTRGWGASALTALAATVKYPAFFFEGVFATDTVRFWSGVGEKTWDSKVWTGAGNLARISDIVETGNIEARGFTVGLSGLDAANLSVVLNQSQRKCTATLWFALLDDAGTVIEATVLDRGFLNQPKISASGNQSGIDITYNSRLVALRRALNRRYTHEDQRTEFPRDLGFEFVPKVVEWAGKWGSA